MEDAALVDALGEEMASGRIVLFTGAGFAQGALACDGKPLPSTEELRSLLWDLVFPDDELDASELGDIYECAVRDASDKARELLERRLRVDASSLPDTYATWYSMPWFRSYTLNIDDLDEAVGRRFNLPVAVRPISALTDRLPGRAPDLLSIHLNGRVGDFPQLTFSQPQYGERTALPDPWYQHLAADLWSHPVLFVGTRLSEPPLWQQLAPRLADPERRREQPRSYLVSSRMPLARSRVLEELNVTWVQMKQAEFAERILSRLDDAAGSGHRALAE